MNGYLAFRYKGTWKVPAGVTKAVVTFRSALFRVSMNKASHFVDENGLLWGTGDAFSGNLGDGTNVSKSFPINLASAKRWIACGTGEDHGIAIEQVTGIAYCWGSASGFGFNIGDGTIIPKSTPTAVAGGRRYIACDVGSNNGAALEKDTLNLYMWGGNFYGGVGDGTTTGRSSPVAVAGMRRVIGFDVGVSHTGMIDVNQDLYTWGDGLSGKLGHGTGNEVSSPTLVVGGKKWLKVAVGNNHTMGLTTDFDVYVWGSHSFGQIGNGVPGSYSVEYSSPVLVAGGRKYIDIAASNDSCYAIEKDTYKAFSWGYNIGGSLGVGDTTARSTPTEVVGGRKYLAIKAGGTGGCFGMMKDTNLPEVGILGWGSNFGGELGNGTTSQFNSPVAVLGFRDFRSGNAPNTFTIDVTPGATITVSPTERIFGGFLAPHAESVYDLIEVRWSE